MIIDIAEHHLSPEWLTSEKVLSQLKHQLTNHGVLAINLLVTDAASFSHSLMMICKTFERRTLCVGVADHKNIVVFAFKQQPKYCTIDEFRGRASALTELWGLDFLILL